MPRIITPVSLLDDGGEIDLHDRLHNWTLLRSRVTEYEPDATRTYPQKKNMKSPVPTKPVQRVIYCDNLFIRV